MSDLLETGYRTLSALYLDGVRVGQLPLLRANPDFAPHLPEPFDAELAAAEHQEWFQRELLPYASVFLEPEGLLGGDVSDSVQRRLDEERLGGGRSEPPDHLGRELELAAALAWRGWDEARFLDGHLLWWLPTFATTAGRVTPPFWKAITRVALDLVIDHRATLVRDRLAEHRPEVGAPWGLSSKSSSVPDLDRATLREVATFLTIPARCGLLLTTADVRELGRSRRLPGGFGSRARVLESVLHSGVAFDALPAVMEGLLAVVRGHRESMADLQEQGLPSEFVEPWLDRLGGTHDLLDRMASGDAPFA